jgi:hypothetical protein
MVSGPAIGLIIAAGIGIVYSLWGILANLLGIGMGMMNRGSSNLPPGFERWANLMGGTMGVFANVIGIAAGAFIVYGALQMKNLTKHGLALSAAIVAMIPCVSPCCLIGLPIGIWAVVMLSKPEVKSHFN